MEKRPTEPHVLMRGTLTGAFQGGSDTSADEINFSPCVGTRWTQTVCPQLTEDNHKLLDKMVLNMFKELNSYSCYTFNDSSRNASSL